MAIVEARAGATQAPAEAAGGQPRLLGELLLAAGLVSPRDLDHALELQRQLGGRLGALLVRTGAISEENLLPVISQQLGFPLVGLADLPEEPEEAAAVMHESGIEPDWWQDQEALAWRDAAGVVRVLSRDPLDPCLVEVVERAFAGQALGWCLARSHDLERMLSRVFARGKGGEASSVEQLRELASEAPVIEFVNNLVAQASDQRASDIHIEPGRQDFDVRMRIDGVLYTRMTLGMDRFGAVASRIKLISGMDISERRLPQDGRMEKRVSGADVDIRVSTVPGVYGESIVMRLLPKESKGYHLAGLGLEADNLERIQRWVNQPHGIVLVTGPTGSGKSTTLYSLLEALNDGKRKIITVEDPVEFRLPRITQIQTHGEIGYTFARALRSILRQDPDIVMVGEIRDAETAEIAIQASLTGHMVLSTLHTNDAISAFTRLIDMGIEPFLVATPVRAVVAQRLVRSLCKACAEPAAPIKDLVEMTLAILPEALRAQPPRWRRAVGCSACQGTGYLGRTGIHELVEVDQQLQAIIVHGASVSEMRDLADSRGYRTLRQDGLVKAWRGLTSVEEVLRVTAS